MNMINFSDLIHYSWFVIHHYVWTFQMAFDQTWKRGSGFQTWQNFTKHAKLIAIAARGGGDPGMNPGYEWQLKMRALKTCRAIILNVRLKRAPVRVKMVCKWRSDVWGLWPSRGGALHWDALLTTKIAPLPTCNTLWIKMVAIWVLLGSVGFLFKKRGMICCQLMIKIPKSLNLPRLMRAPKMWKWAMIRLRFIPIRTIWWNQNATRDRWHEGRIGGVNLYSTDWSYDLKSETAKNF